MNGDGYDDIIIGASHADSSSKTNSGTSYVIFGISSSFVDIDLAYLNSSQGFKIFGAVTNDNAGNSVSRAGDINGDGYDDIIIGVSLSDGDSISRVDSGTSYVIFGKSSNFLDIDLMYLTSAQGFKIFGQTVYDYSGNSVSSAGDFNGDGYGDVIIGASYANPSYRNDAGAVYIIFNSAATASPTSIPTTKPSSVPTFIPTNKPSFIPTVLPTIKPTISLEPTMPAKELSDIALYNLNIAQGFKISGEAISDYTGCSVSNAGDINGDGYDDIIIGAYQADPNDKVDAGTVYVIFGKSSGFTDVDLSLLSSSQGFKIFGAATSDYSGNSVSSAGDFNGDGYDDVVIGSRNAAPNGRSNAGTSYVIFGKSSGFTDVDLSLLSSSQGFKIFGATSGDYSSCSVASADDVNGDGYTDIIIGAYRADPNGRDSAGTTYVIFGKAAGLTDIDLAALNLSQGFKILGAAINDYSGYSVSGAGDVNGDGYDDIIIGAYGADSTSRTDAGASYVIFGKFSGFTDIDLLFLTLEQGFKIFGAAASDASGISVSGAGDMNGDGYDDIIIGAPQADSTFRTNSGVSYVIFGKSSGFTNMFLPLSYQNFVSGFRVLGAKTDDYSGSSVSSAGDVNGDGYDDIIIGAHGADPSSITDAGTSYVVFGKRDSFIDVDLASLTLTQGYKILGSASGDYAGYSVSGAGDVNGDGYDDIIIGAPNADPNGRSNAGEVYIIHNVATTNIPTNTPTFKPTAPTVSPTAVPTTTPTAIPTHTPTSKPIIMLTNFPTALPTKSPSKVPSMAPTIEPTISPTKSPTMKPTTHPTFILTGTPTSVPSSAASEQPSTSNIVPISIQIEGPNNLIYDRKITIQGGNLEDSVTVGKAGDVNGDGFDDIIIGFPRANQEDTNPNTREGISYVIFGSNTELDNINLDTIEGDRGFSITGYIYSGSSVNGLGDINGDGYDDIGIGSHFTDYSAVIFGKANAFTDIKFSEITQTTQGFILHISYTPGTVSVGDPSNIRSMGTVISGAGDVNGDGYDDIIIALGISNANYSPIILGGISYVIYGRDEYSSVLVDAASEVNNKRGFYIYSSCGDENLGASASGAGDINRDGYDDIIIGAPNYRGGQSASFVIFGTENNPMRIDVSNLLANQGFAIRSINSQYQDWNIGASVSGAGDVNGDGYDDIIIGAPGTRPTGNSNIAGTSYIIFGKSSDFRDIDLSSLSLGEGFSFVGNGWFTTETNSRNEGLSGVSVSSAGDINNDGYNDVIIGGYSGGGHVLFGKINDFSNMDSSDLKENSSQGFSFFTKSGGLLTKVSCLGDFDGDGYDDVAVAITPAVHIIFGINSVSSSSRIKSKTKQKLMNHDFSSLSSTNNQYISELIEQEPYLEVEGEVCNMQTIGDINNDGYNDIAIRLSDEKDIYVVFGGVRGEKINLNKFSSSYGFIIKGSDTDCYNFVYGCGDINGDGINDLMGKYRNEAYVLFSSKVQYSNISLDSLPSTHGFFIGDKDSNEYYIDIDQAGDFNGDGFDDLVILRENNLLANCYIIYGKDGKESNFSYVDLSTKDANSNYYIFIESERLYSCGQKIGDINDDGYDDIIILSSVDGYTGAVGHVIFGKSSPLTDIILLDLQTNQGFSLIDDSPHRYTTSLLVSMVGDVNGDGVSDIILSSPTSSFKGMITAGISYVMYGQKLGFDSHTKVPGTNYISLIGLLKTQGFSIIGNAWDYSGTYSYGIIGDINGDNFYDVIASSKDRSTDNVRNVYNVIFGSPNREKEINLGDLQFNQGFKIINDLDDYRSFSVSNLGDTNRDNLADILIGIQYIKKYAIYIKFGTLLEVDFSITVPYIETTYCPIQTNFPTSSPSHVPKIVIVLDKIYAVFSREVYTNPGHTLILSEVNENGSRLPNGWSVLLDSESAGIVSDNTIPWGFFAKAYKNDFSDNIVVAFQGTDDLYDVFSADSDLALGKVPAHYSSAKEFVDYISNYYHINLNVISFTGHSLGGFLAQLMSATYNKSAVVFDSPGAERVITDYYGDNSYSIKYSLSEISDKVKCFNSAPNLINIASGAHFESVIRLFPEVDPNSIIYTLQQHDMSNILLQFKDTNGEAKISSNMNGYWKFSGTINNWPFFQVTSITDAVKQNSFLNGIFFNNYNQNPYFWELAWDQSPNINSLFSPSTASRIKKIEISMSGSISDSVLGEVGIVINGNDDGNKFFGGTNYADVMIGGKGNDEYWPFSGFNTITDTGGRNNYYFYTHNMKGTTVISDKDKTGVIQFVNIGCSIGDTYQIDFGTNIGNYVFFSQFFSEITSSSLCDLTKYSSGIRDKLDPTLNQYINHKNDVLLLYSDYPSDGELLISYNDNDRDDSVNNKIAIKDFQEGDFAINLGNDADQETYVAVGSNVNDLFACSTEQNSILAGLGGINKYIITLFNDKACSIISNDGDSNIYKIFSAESSRFLSEYLNTEEAKTGVVNNFGLKNTDVIDLSSIGLSSFSDLSFTLLGNDTVITLPGGMTMRLDSTQTFVATIDGTNLALYNSTNHSYTTDLVGAGINITSIYNALNTIFPTELPTRAPTILPTLDQDSKNQNNENDVITINDGIIAVIAVGGVALLSIGGYALYAYFNNNYCPFSFFTSVPTQDVVDVVIKGANQAGGEIIAKQLEEGVAHTYEMVQQQGLELVGIGMEEIL